MVRKKFYKSKEWLRKRFIDDELSSYQIADILDINQATVHRWITKFKLNRKKLPLSEETKNKIRTTLKKKYLLGQLSPNIGGEPTKYAIRRLKESNIGRKHTKEHIAKRVAKYTGKKHPNYRHGHYCGQINKTAEWANWRKNVYERDDFTCIDCSSRGVLLDPHHIKPKSKYPELIFSVDNGVTLCRGCHDKTKGNEHLVQKKYETYVANVGGD